MGGKPREAPGRMPNNNTISTAGRYHYGKARRRRVDEMQENRGGRYAEAESESAPEIG